MLNECNLKNFIEWVIQHCDKNTSNKVSSFNELVKCLRNNCRSLRNNCRSTIVEYKQDINDVMENAENKLELGNGKNRKRCYGVYIIYCVCKPEKNDDCKKMIEEGRGEVLYIGKGGTLEWDASYKEQDVIERIFKARRSINTNFIERLLRDFMESLKERLIQEINERKERLIKEINESENSNKESSLVEEIKRLIEKINENSNKKSFSIEVSSEVWFKCLCKVCELLPSKKASSQSCEPKLCIEIICIDVLDDNNRKPQCKLLTPAFIESLLLSCYLCEKGKLPLFNEEL